MFSRLKKLYEQIKNINKSVDNYQNDTIIQSLPTVAYVNKAKKFIEEKDYNTAIQILNEALDISDSDPLVYKYLGRISEYNRNFNDSVKYYEKVTKLNSGDKDVWLRLGMCYLYTDLLDKAIAAFELANKLLPMNTDVYTGWGMVFMRQKKYALAKDKFNIAAQISKYNFTAILMSAVMEKRLGEYAIAEEKLRFLVKVAPNEGSLYEYAHLKLFQNKYDEAELYANQTLALNKLMLPAYFILGEVFSIQKDYQKTVDNFKTAERLGLKNSTLYVEWGKALVRLLNFEYAQEIFKNALAIDPCDNDAKIGLALINSYSNDFALLENLKDKNQNNVYIKEAIGLQMLCNGEYKNAVEMFKKALSIDKHQTYNYYNLAVAYEKLNDSYKVREYFDKFIQYNPEYAKGLNEYGKWLINVSDFEEAQRKLKKAKKLDADNVDTINMLFLTYHALVKKNFSEYNVKEAISIANKALELGRFDYMPQKQELEQMLGNFQGN